MADNFQKTWKQFTARHPALADNEAPLRKFGDYRYDTTYRPAVASGRMTYLDALEATARDVYREAGREDLDPHRVARLVQQMREKRGLPRQ